MKRRNLLVLGGMAAIAAGWQVFGVRRTALEFSALRHYPGWRFATLGGVSGLTSSDLLTIGLEEPAPVLAAGELDAAVHHQNNSGAVPVAVFSDFFCPFCRGLIGRLRARSSGPAIGITWHELPLLGPNSVLAARAALAAEQQGGYSRFYDALLSEGFKPVPRWMGEVAERAGLDGALLLRDMDRRAVAQKLELSARAASTLGFFGTPGIVIGRDAVLGALDAADMERLIAETARL